jgi:phytoene dehydrogenase-like protein
MAMTIAREAWNRGPRALAAWFGEALRPSRNYLESTYSSDAIHALWAPWGLHCGLNPESAYSAQMVKLIAFSVEFAGCPIAVGGAKNLTAAFARLIADQGGRVQCDADVERIETDVGGSRRAVRLATGERIDAALGVLCSMTPTQLYGRLLRGHPAAAEATKALKHYRYGKGDLQIHYALDAPPKWKGSQDLSRVALLHVTPGLDGVSRAANECERGLLPAEPTICVGQPTALDPSRAPEGKAILWLQLPEAPRVIKGDAKGEISAPPNGGWTEGVREAFADRAELLLARHVEDFRSHVIARRSYSPADLETMNVSLVGGDPYGGYCGLDQFFVWRPFPDSTNHGTAVPGVYHIGASTHPGPGLGGGSGFMLANALK